MWKELLGNVDRQLFGDLTRLGHLIQGAWERLLGMGKEFADANESCSQQLFVNLSTNSTVVL